MLTSVRRCVCFLYSAILFFSAIARTTGAEPPRFRTHTVSATSEFAACAAIDVNDDGKLDIVSGGFWYEAPNWKQHFLRDVEVIRGRFDDYSHLPMDVNGDGRVDYVSANYRSQSIYWVENAGADAIPWKKHVVAEPGPMETAIMVDVDGDGRNDVLPNGTKFAAWWEVIPPTEAKGNPVWLRHDLPMEVAGHGVGFGDVNGDGRGDIVAAHGWLEALRIDALDGGCSTANSRWTAIAASRCWLSTWTATATMILCGDAGISSVCTGLSRDKLTESASGCGIRSIASGRKRIRSTGLI